MSKDRVNKNDANAHSDGRGGFAPLAVHLIEEVEQGFRNKIGVRISEGSAGPSDAGGCGWPDSEDRAAMWIGEPPEIDYALRRRMHDMNKELAEHLRSCITVKMGRKVFSPFRTSYKHRP